MHWYKFSLFIYFTFLLQLVFSQEKSDFIKIYTNILNKSCALGGCHDGSFEPNFTSIMSSFNTLVNHPIVKNNRQKSFEYRVVPFDYKKSVLYERITNYCFVDEGDRMPFYDKDGLSKKEIDLIKSWINEGAPDIYGNISAPLQYFPKIKSIEICKILKSSQRLIPIRQHIENDYSEIVSLRLKTNENYHLKIDLDDTRFNENEFLDNLMINILSASNEVEASFLVQYDEQNNQLKATISTNNLKRNSQYTFQLFIESIQFYYPSNATPPYLMYFWHFYLQ